MIKVLIYDQDKDYIAHLMHQLSRKSAGIYLFTACSSMESFKGYIENGSHWDAILYDAKGYDMDRFAFPECHLIPLVESRLENTVAELHKYQQIDSFMDQLGDLLGVKSNLIVEEGQSQVMVVLSAEGGSGKSAFASALAKLEADRHETVLLSFDVYSDMALTLEVSASRSMTDLFYYVKKQDFGWLKGFQNQLVKDDYLDFTVATSFCCARDMAELTKADLEIFFRTLQEECHFKRVIIDTSNIGPLFFELIGHADVAWVIEGNGPHSAFRSQKLLEDLNKLINGQSLKIKKVKNRSDSTQGHPAEGLSAEGLPFDPQLRASYRAKSYALGGMPYYRALKDLLERRA